MAFDYCIGNTASLTAGEENRQTSDSQDDGGRGDITTDSSLINDQINIELSNPSSKLAFICQSEQKESCNDPPKLRVVLSLLLLATLMTPS